MCAFMLLRRRLAVVVAVAVAFRVCASIRARSNALDYIV